MTYTPEEQAIARIFGMLENAIEVHAEIDDGPDVTMTDAMDGGDCRRVTIGRETYRVQITRIRPQAGE